MRARERKRESKREREREREVFGNRENEGYENPETSKGFFFIYGNGWVEFGYIVFGLNGSQWIFS